MRKKIWLGLLIFCLLFSAAPVSASTLNLVDASGALLRKVPVLKEGGDFFVDLYDFFQALDYKVSWREEVSRLEVRGEEKNFNFTPWNRRVLIGEQSFPVPRQPVLRNERLFLPAQVTAEILNEHTSRSVIWNSTRAQMQLVEARTEAEEEQSDPIGSFLEETSESGNGRSVVVIDPGHGGQDPGAIGTNGLQEKEVVTQIAHKLKNEFEKNYENIKPVLTRDEDEFIPLKDRTRMANELDADIFLSIHANSGYTEYASGFEVFTLSSKPSDPSAKELAEIENSALRYEGYDQDELDDISWILWQLRGTAYARMSKKLAQGLVTKLNREISTPNRGVKGAPFWVLKDAQMPAVLVETGFLSNPSEEKKLRTTEYQKSVARALARSVAGFARKHF